ncbi:MAG TPA: hypothetical protein PKC39_07465 [Ferruginibacter sp.]|nr:hypothetical protein [Ferruginibacter sp.]HMP20781.1 hypothetical protein [Ferruginibacter sp.]
MTAKKKKADEKTKVEVKFYDEVCLSRKLGINRRKFHREIKPLIVSDFQELIKEIGDENPDIGLDSEDKLYLGNISHTIVKPTGLSIFDYI